MSDQSEQQTDDSTAPVDAVVMRRAFRIPVNWLLSLMRRLFARDRPFGFCFNCSPTGRAIYPPRTKHCPYCKSGPGKSFSDLLRELDA